MDDERIALNQFAFRKANETIALRAGDEAVDFLCECGRGDCAAKVPLTRAAYEAVRANARHFVCAPGHLTPAIERIVEALDGYSIVEKSGEAGELAEATDPRG